ncbi:MAG: hypothetical protein K0R15_2828 [Clostridiales bacterium]|jgi:hypothetical protein|nr:hypothetical protein [Clostridiales bacterium]
MGQQDQCEQCINYIYDEEYECHMCQVNFDEDELVRLSYNSNYRCPNFRFGDEYSIVKKQN